MTWLTPVIVVVGAVAVFFMVRFVVRFYKVLIAIKEQDRVSLSDRERSRIDYFLRQRRDVSNLIGHLRRMSNPDSRSSSAQLMGELGRLRNFFTAQMINIRRESRNLTALDNYIVERGRELEAEGQDSDGMLRWLGIDAEEIRESGYRGATIGAHVGETVQRVTEAADNLFEPVRSRRTEAPNAPVQSQNSRTQQHQALQRILLNPLGLGQQDVSIEEQRRAQREGREEREQLLKQSFNPDDKEFEVKEENESEAFNVNKMILDDLMEGKNEVD